MPLLTDIPPNNRYDAPNEHESFNHWLKIGYIVAAAVLAVSFAICFFAEYHSSTPKAAEADKKETAKQPAAPAEPPPDLDHPVRPAPKAFPRDFNMPRGKESANSGSIDLATFHAQASLTRFEDKRVWFDSDNKKSANHEDDHIINRAMEVPLKRLANLVAQKGGRLKIQDAYRAPEKNPIHQDKSLHLEGRAIDLTCEKLSLGELAKLAWQSGFDFVLYEAPRKGGDHIHASVKRPAEAPAARK